MMPHAVQTVEELSVVSDLSNWGNCNVQFIGKLFDSAGDSGVYTCVGIESIKTKKATTEKTKEIIVDFSLAADIPPRNVLVRIWGELELKMINSRMSPYVRAKIARVIGTIDFPLYRKALEVRQEYTPHFAPSASSKRKHDQDE